mmetsp:Transcript_23988/g.35420  ORF Transcript_23988/g.35420 Transcript_23988/m.35420 type:complete len:85 (+) Transcript_23988:370-624(+)
MVMVETDVDDGSPTLPKTWKASGSYRWTVIAQTKGPTNETSSLIPIAFDKIQTDSSTKIQSVCRMFIAKKQVAAARDAATLNDT